LRHPGIALAHLDEPPARLVSWLAGQLDIPEAAFADYARRPQTMTDHARQLARLLGLRLSGVADLPLMIEAAAQGAWSTDAGRPITASVLRALHIAGIILPSAPVIERAAIAGRARARKRAADALLSGLTGQQLHDLDGLLVTDPSVGITPFGWIEAIPVAPKADHVGELLDRLRRVRALGLPPERRARPRGPAPAVRARRSRFGRPPTRPLRRAPAPRDPGCDRDRSRGPPDGRSAGHGRQADRRPVREGAQRGQTALCCQRRRCRSADAFVPRHDRRACRGPHRGR
ncbi:MAG: DUF4158 domain-containing protein, partial [Acetobacteraceae bacterium]|nr:DUF4158 domain-containing protein [Acetobacteraceae bacterium]